MTMIRNGANPRIIIECLLDQIQGIGDNFRDLHSRGSEHGNKHLNDKGEVSSHFTPHGTMSGSQEVVRVGDYVYRGSINVHGATVAYDGKKK